MRYLRSLGRRWALMALAAVVAVALVAVGCGGGSATGAKPSTVASFIPAGSPVYIEVSTDLDGPQWAQVKTLAKRFPSYPRLERWLREELAGEGVDFDRDVRPILGDRAGGALLAPPELSSDPASAFDASGFVVVASLAEGKEADAVALFKKDGATLQGQHAGVDVYGDDGGRFAVLDGAIILTESDADMNAAIDARQAGGERTLAGSDRFADAVAKLPSDVFAQGFLDLGGVFRSVLAEDPELAGIGDLGLGNAAVAFSVAAEADGVRIKGATVGLPDVLAGSEIAPTLAASHVPGDAVLYAGFGNLTGIVQQVFGGLSGILGEEAEVDAFLSQIEPVLGVSLDDLAALGRGEHALVVTGGDPVPSVSLALAVEDGARAKRTLDTLRERVPPLLSTFMPDLELPDFRPVALANGVRGWQLPISPEFGLVYGVDGDLVVIGSQPDGVRQVQSPLTTLADNPDFRAATAQMPGRVAGLLWIDGRRAVTALQRLGVFDAGDAELLANLRTIRSITAWGTGGETPTFEAFVRID